MLWCMLLAQFIVNIKFYFVCAVSTWMLPSLVYNASLRWHRDEAVSRGPITSLLTENNARARLVRHKRENGSRCPRSPYLKTIQGCSRERDGIWSETSRELVLEFREVTGRSFHLITCSHVTFVDSCSLPLLFYLFPCAWHSFVVSSAFPSLAGPIVVLFVIRLQWSP